MPIGYSRNEGAPKARRCQRLLDTLSPTNAARATARPCRMRGTQDNCHVLTCRSFSFFGFPAPHNVAKRQDKPRSHP